MQFFIRVKSQNTPLFENRSGESCKKMPRNSSSATVMKCEIKNVGFRIRFFANGGRSLNINHKLKIAIFTLSRTKVHGKIIFLMNGY